MNKHPKTLRSNRGSVLIAALGLSIILALILTSHVSLARNAVTLSNRSFYDNASLRAF